MPSQRFKTISSGRSARNTSNSFLSFTTGGPSYHHYGNVYSSSDMAHVEDSASDLAHVDKRSAHNALERQRRENLNSKFQQLALALPSLHTVRRPSKTVIVSKSLEFVSSSVNRETNFQSQIEHLRRENERLRDQATRTKHQKQQRQQQSLNGGNSSTIVVGGTISSSSSSAPSLLEQHQREQQQQPMYLSPGLLLSKSPVPLEQQVSMGSATNTTEEAATYNESSSKNSVEIQLSPSSSSTPVKVQNSTATTTPGNTTVDKKSLPTTSNKCTSPKRKVFEVFENNNEVIKCEKTSPDQENDKLTLSLTNDNQKMRQNSTSSLDASFMLMTTTTGAAPPLDQSACAVVNTFLNPQQQQQQQQQEQSTMKAQRRRHSSTKQQKSVIPGFHNPQQQAAIAFFHQQQNYQQHQHAMVRTGSGNSGDITPPESFIMYPHQHSNYYDHQQQQQQQQQQQFIMNMSDVATGGISQFLDAHHHQQQQHPASTLLVNSGNYVIPPRPNSMVDMRYDNPPTAAPNTTTSAPVYSMQDANSMPIAAAAAAATTAVNMPTSLAVQQYPLMDMPSMYPPPYFQHDPNNDYNNMFHWL